MTAMLKRFVFAAVVLAVVFGGVIGFKLYKQAKIRDHLASAGVPAVHVTAAVATNATWDQRLAAIGSLRAQHGIDIRSEVDGVIRRVRATSRQAVREGDVLLELDDAIEQASLKSVQARLEKTRLDFERGRSLIERRLISETQFDTLRTEFEGAMALAEETLAVIDQKTIRAPFSGTVGIHDLAEGHYLESGDALMTLQALDRLYLDLYLPEKEIERLRPGQRVLFTVSGHGDRQFEGEVRFVDVVVQVNTRNVLVRAEVGNAGHELLPGMFASASVILDEARDVVVVPRESVAFTLYGETVYLLEKAGQGTDSAWVARRKPVKSGEARGDSVTVSGLNAGQLIARDTQHRLLDGTPVIMENPAVLESRGDTVVPD